MEIKLIGLQIKNRSTQHITRHQIGCKLYAAKLSVNQTRRKTGKQCFRHTGHTLYQHMTVGKNRRKDKIYRAFLSHNDRSDPCFQRTDLFGKKS